MHSKRDGYIHRCNRFFEDGLSMQHLMEYGLRPVIAETGEQVFEWSHFVHLHPNKHLVDLQAYGALIVRCLAEKEGSKALPEGFSLESIFAPYAHEAVSPSLNRLGSSLLA